MRNRAGWRGAALALAAAAAALLALAGCGRRPPAPEDPAEFLMWSLVRHGELKTFRATCAWEMDSPVPGQLAPRMTRTIVYSKPNHFRVTAQLPDGLTLTSQCAGKEEVQFDSGGSTVYILPPPPHMGDSQGVYLRHPLMLGTLLYRMLQGPTTAEQIVDTDKDPARFLDDVTLDGVKCRVVAFYGRGSFGHVDLAIGAEDGLVRRVRFDSEPVVKKYEAAMGPGHGPMRPTQAVELYTNIKTDEPVSDADLAVTMPAGARRVMVTDPEEQERAGLIGQPAPKVSFVGMDGNPVKLDQFLGKVVLLDFWATWCGPCLQALPDTQKLYSDLKDRGLAVLAVTNEGKGPASALFRSRGFTMPWAIDPDDKAAKRFGVHALPTVVVITREGRVSAIRTGVRGIDALKMELRKAGLSAAE